MNATFPDSGIFQKRVILKQISVSWFWVKHPDWEEGVTAFLHWKKKMESVRDKKIKIISASLVARWCKSTKTEIRNNGINFRKPLFFYTGLHNPSYETVSDLEIFWKMIKIHQDLLTFDNLDFVKCSLNSYSMTFNCLCQSSCVMFL